MKKYSYLLISIQMLACGTTASSPTPVAAPAPTVKVASSLPVSSTMASQAVGHPREDLVPRAVLFGNPERTGLLISPDGKYLSWLAPKEGVLNVWVAPIGKMDQARAVTTEGKRPIRQYFWAYTNKHILYLQDSAGDENFHVYRTDLVDGKITDLTPWAGVRAGLVQQSEKYPQKVLVRMNDRDRKLFDLHLIDLLTGQHELIMKNDDNFISYQVDNNMKVRLGFKRHADGSTQVFENSKVGWRPWDTIPFEDAETTRTLAFTHNNRSVYLAESRGRNTGALIEMTLATKKAKVLAEDDRADLRGTMIHPTKRHVQAVSFNYNRLRWKILDKSIQKDMDNLAKLEADAEIHVVSRPLHDRVWVVSTVSEMRGIRYYLWERPQQKATYLFAAQPELEKQPLVKMWPLEIKARDGLTLMSYLTLPRSADPDSDGRSNATVPLVLWVHGGPWARNTWGYDPVHQLLANRGYAVLSVNYRGSTGFGKAFLNASNLQWGKRMHDDLIDAVSWAIAERVTTRDRVGIMGISYGGYATLAGLTLTPDVFACGVDIVGPSNILTLLASIPPYWTPVLAMFHARIGNPDTSEGKALLEAASPLNHAAKIRRPLLIAQGANDPRVKQAESEQIVAAMRAHNLPVTYALFPDEGHGFARPENNILFLGITEAFLSAHLGGDYLPLTRAEIEASTVQIKEGRAGIPSFN